MNLLVVLHGDGVNHYTFAEEVKKGTNLNKHYFWLAAAML